MVGAQTPLERFYPRFRLSRSGRITLRRYQSELVERQALSLRQAVLQRELQQRAIQYAEVRVRIPVPLSDTERELFQHLPRSNLMILLAAMNQTAMHAHGIA